MYHRDAVETRATRYYDITKDDLHERTNILRTRQRRPCPTPSVFYAMKNRNMAPFGTGSSDSFEVYTVDNTPENLNLENKFPIPTIRLTQATPSDNSIPSIIAPKASPRKKVVPRKSKLALLAVRATSSREKDLSDVVRRVNASTTNLDGNGTCNVTVNGGTTMKMKDLLKFKDRSSRSTIDIYVDPANDPDIGEIVVVKKRKSRAKLDGLFENKGNLNVKEGERGESKWWSIRGKKKERHRNNSLNALKTNLTQPNSILPEARQRCGSTPLSPPDSGHTSSIALRAMKSIARIGSWAQLKNNNVTHDIHQYDSHPPGPRVKSSISSFEIGALSTHTGEDLTNRFSPIASLGRGQFLAQHRFLNPSITNTNVRQRTSSSGTLLSVNSSTNYLQPYDHRRLSTSSSSGESNRPGSTYTASGEDTNAWGTSTKLSRSRSKRGMSIRWGSVSSALALTNVKKKLHKEQSAEADKGDRGKTSKSNKKSKAEKTKRSSESHKENVFPKDKEALSKGSHRYTTESRRRTPVMSIFPGLNFGRSIADVTALAPKSSMPPIAENSDRSRVMNLIPENMKQHDCHAVVTSEEIDCELSDSDSDLWNKNSVQDEEACIRLSAKIISDERLNDNREFEHIYGCYSLLITAVSAAKCNASSVDDGLLPLRHLVRSLPVSEQLLTSSQPSRPVGMILDIDISDMGFGNKEDGMDWTYFQFYVVLVLCFILHLVVALSVLEAANSDLASLINRLDLEATPDKDRDTTTSYVKSIAARRASEATVTQGVVSAFHVEHQDARRSLLTGRHSLDSHNSVFREKNALSLGDKTETFKLTYPDPIAFLDPTSDSNIDPSGSLMGESFAFVNNINGIPPEESPLRRIGKIRAMTRAMGAATNMAGATMSKRFSAISATTRTSVTSLRPYAYTTLRDKDKDDKQPIKDVFDSTVAPETFNRASLSSKFTETDQISVISKQRIASECGFKTQIGLSDRPSWVTRSNPCHTDNDSEVLPFERLRTSSSRVSRASSTASTFGTGTVLAKMRKTQLGKSKTGTSVSEPHQIGNSPSRTSETGQRSLKYTLPSLASVDRNPVSLYPNQFGVEDTPTLPERNSGHVRQNSTLIPIVHPVSHGIDVKSKVKHIELLTRSECQREDKEREEISRRGALKQTARTNRASTSSLGSHSSAPSHTPLFGRVSKRLSASPPPVDTRRQLESRSIIGFANREDRSIYDELNSDIPHELQNVLSSNRRFLDVFSLVPPQNTSSAVASPSTSSSSPFPPSPGLPPTSPLPVPTGQSIILPTPTSTNTSNVVMEPSPPAPSLLPFIDSSPSPDADKPPTSIFAFTVVPPQNQQTLSEDGDIDEPMPRAVSRTGLSISGSGSDDDTKQSFDFTGELKRLNESGGSHRRSFVEQLDAAFKTPVHINVRGGLCSKGGASDKPVSPLPPFPALNMQLDAEMEEGLSSMMAALNESMNNLEVDSSSLQLYQGVMVKPSYGRLDTAFKFGGRPQPALTRPGEMLSDSSIARELPDMTTLSTSPLHQLRSSVLLPRSPVNLSTSSVNEDDFSSSIYARTAVNDMSKLMETYMSNFADNNETSQVSSCSLDPKSDISPKRRVRIDATRTEKAQLPTHARQSSDASFSGLSSFAAIRTKFEFGSDRPDFYSSLHLSQISSHLRHESLFSLASVSSYGEVIKPGSNDPFNYADLFINDDEEARDELPRLDSFEDTKRRKRLSADSDRSSFYFKPGGGRIHARNQSIVSTNSMNAPPISLYNRNLGHRRDDSGGSMNSVAAAYSIQGANSGRAAWMRHQREQSVDSAISDFSAIRLGRPGVGDKMFESIADHYPLTSISASPPESVSGDLAQKSSYDSILDEERRSTVDSIFDNTGHRSSISSDSVFWHDPTNENEQQSRDMIRQNLFPPSNFFRPLSIISNGNPGTPQEDDTMITMLGGEHVRRRSLGSSFEASPCFRVEKQKRELGQDYVHIRGHDTDDGVDDALVDSASPTAKIMGGGVSLVHKESVASAKSNKFGETRMNLARNGLLHRESLEDSCLSAEGEEDLSMISSRSNGFSKPPPRRRQRKPIVTISHPPETTPPLSSSEGSGESQSSIDVERLTVLLQTAAAGTRSSVSRVRPGNRIRAPGQGHRRRASQVSRGSMIGTIQEETVTNVSPRPVVVSEDDTSKARRNSLEGYSFEPLKLKMANLSAVSEPHIIEVQGWDEERWVIGLRRYYALRNEAYEEINHSRLVWPDTPFSLHALQTFVPPRAPVAMQALLEHSQKSYVPLPVDSYPCRVRSRVSSIPRSTPYCRPGSSDGGSTKSKKSHSRSRSRSGTDISVSSSSTSRALQSKNMNISTTASPVSMLATTIDLGYDNNNDPSTEESFLTFAAISGTVKERIEPMSVIKPSVRPRVPSEARRTALGWSKRKTLKNNEEGESNNKENEARGLLTSPSESLRIARPRPRSRMIVNAAPRSTALLLS
ncbi:hypothetical protein Clacol_007313 [Clathrus columnatus]|uniref:Uncharacterized protein n=1 Tax=Clathrus columnatus TaxID=1419009 RepID=A0AAV5AEJ8_9AGAM|nr:hypothetical protein Clacol_007313 [Clathrus columnatus]